MTVRDSLDRLRSLFRVEARPDPRLTPKRRDRLREQLQECAKGLGGEVSARVRAASLGETYLQLDDAGRHEFLRLIALEFGPDPRAVERAHNAYQAAIGTPAQWDAEAELRAAMRSARIRILTQFNALPQGVKFLVDLRADLLRFLDQDRELAVLDRELAARLSAWFDVGFLELQRITWNSPATLLEKLMKYEAVHEIRSWDDLRNRLDSDRRCYAFFHPRMPMEPLIFVEIALTRGLADNVQHLLDEAAPVLDAQRAEAAIFYSISNTQPGFRGISFGNFLLKRVIDDLKRDYPRLKTFATLSPMPQFRRWLRANAQELEATASAAELRLIAEAAGEKDRSAALPAILAGDEWHRSPALADALRAPLLRVAARYLTEVKDQGRPVDPVARFHFGNGARIERLNWLADTSRKGLAQSFGLMVNYRYDPDAIEDNVEAYVRDGRIDEAPEIKRLRKEAQRAATTGTG